MELLGAGIIAVLVGQAAPEVPSDAVTKVSSVWDFVVKGGPVMVPIILASLVALAVVVERFFSLRRRVVIPPEFMPAMKVLMAAGGRDHSKALQHGQNHPSPVANIVTVAIKRSALPVERLEHYVREAGEYEVSRLRRGFGVLSLVISISPMLGLLGTIFGMISAFQTVAASGEALGKTELLAKGIYEALITTAAGLLVAIPVLVALHALSAKANGLVLEMDALAVDFVEQFVPAARQTGSEETIQGGSDGRMTESDVETTGSLMVAAA